MQSDDTFRAFCTQCWSRWAYNLRVFSRLFLLTCLFIIFHGFLILSEWLSIDSVKLTVDPACLKIIYISEFYI